MFQTTQRIIEKTEGYLLGLPPDNKIWSLATRLIIFPYKYLRLGIKELFRPASLWAFISFALLLISMFTICKLDIDKQYSLFIFNLCIYTPMALVIFAIPSTYCYYGVTEKIVNEIVIFLEHESVDSIDEVELLEENIKIIYSRILSRVSFYKWLIGAVWTVYIVILNIEIRILLKAQAAGWEQTVMENAFTSAIIIVITLIALTLIVGYKRASELLVKSIEFSCVEHKHRLLKSA